MEALIIKGIALGLFTYTDGKGFVCRVTDPALLLAELTKCKAITPTISLVRE